MSLQYLFARMPVRHFRVLAAIALAVIFFGVFALLLIVGVNSRSAKLVVTAFIVLAAIAGLIYFQTRKVKEQERMR